MLEVMLATVTQTPWWAWIVGFVVVFAFCFVVIIGVVAAVFNPHANEQLRVQRRINTKSVDAKSGGTSPNAGKAPEAGSQKPGWFKKTTNWVKDALLPKILLIMVFGWITYEIFQPTLGEMNTWVVVHKFWIGVMCLVAWVLLQFGTSTIKDASQRKHLASGVIFVAVFLIVVVPTLNFIYGVCLGLQNPATTDTGSGSRFTVTLPAGEDTRVIDIPLGYAASVSGTLPFETEQIYGDGKSCWSPFTDCPPEATGPTSFLVKSLATGEAPNKITYWFVNEQS